MKLAGKSLRMVLLATAMAILVAAQTTEIPVLKDQNDFEFVGQFNNTPSTSLQPLLGSCHGHATVSA